jgi:hypothetical protein
MVATPILEELNWKANVNISILFVNFVGKVEAIHRKI